MPWFCTQGKTQCPKDSGGLASFAREIEPDLPRRKVVEVSLQHDYFALSLPRVGPFDEFAMFGKQPVPLQSGEVGSPGLPDNDLHGESELIVYPHALILHRGRREPFLS
jgi:hypothetical protein